MSHRQTWVGYGQALVAGLLTPNRHLRSCSSAVVGAAMEVVLGEAKSARPYEVEAAQAEL